MHRFIPIYAAWMGAKVAELPVHHYPRKFGQSKYGLERVIKVVLDLMVVKFFSKYLVKPIYVFGGFAAWSVFVAALVFGYMVYLKVYEGTDFILTPLPVLSTMFFLIGVIAIFMGILAEILVRTYFESQGLRSYQVRTRINFNN